MEIGFKALDDKSHWQPQNVCQRTRAGAGYALPRLRRRDIVSRLMFCYRDGIDHHPVPCVADRIPDAEASRLHALDALRGLSILLMVFSGRIPFGVLPEWMYHAQVPPPNHVFNPNLPGITWVDLVFPFFLFTMGAAIPFALGRRIERGDSIWKLSAYILQRGFLLAAFAIYVMHIRPWLLSDAPRASDWLFALLGFFLLFPMLAAVPAHWRPATRVAVRCIGWIGAALLLGTVRYADGSGFSLSRSDIIILVLSNVAVAGSFIWLWTRTRVLLRIGLLGVLLALRLTHGDEGVGKWLWEISPMPWLFQTRFLQYLFITIPGTMVGDLLSRWMKDRHAGNDTAPWSRPRYAHVAVWMVILNVVTVIGLKQRFVVETTVLVLILCILVAVLMRKPLHPTDTLLQKLFSWGFFLLLLGLAFEPYEGGIKKDHATMSYYFVTTGLAIFMLIAFIVVFDVLRWKRGFGLIIRAGQNPLVAYAGVNSLVPPIFGITGLDGVLAALTPTPWLGVARGAFYTYLVALASAFCAKKKIFLKT